MFQIRKHKEKVTTPPAILLENRQTSNPYSLLKAGGDPAMINQDHFFTSLLLQIKRVIIKQLISSLRMCHLLNFEKKVNDNTY